MPVTEKSQQCRGKYVYGKAPNFTDGQLGFAKETYYCGRCGKAYSSLGYKPDPDERCQNYLRYEEAPYFPERGGEPGWYISDNGYLWKTYY